MKIADIDRILLRYADSHSPAELSLMVKGALSPAECSARVASLLEKQDWLTMTQQDALVTLKMRQLIAELEDQPRSTRNAEVLIRALETLGNRLEKRATAIESDLNRLYAWQGQLLMEALTIIVEHLQARLSLDGDDFKDAVEEGMRRAGALLASHDDRSGVPLITTLPEAPTGPSVVSPAAASLTAGADEASEPDESEEGDE